MRAEIQPAKLQGTIPSIASKSQAHRLLICAALADRPSKIACATRSADITATAECLNALGAEIHYGQGLFSVRPLGKVRTGATLPCGESGSTLRFLLPVVCALGAEARLTMGGRLPERPLSPLWEELVRHGADLTRPEPDIIQVSGCLAPGEYTMAANISSQFLSGLLFALPLLEGDSTLRLTETLESGAYLAMTEKALEKFGVPCPRKETIYQIPGGRQYTCPENGYVEVEGDWSNSAFWIVASRICGGTVTVTGLDNQSPQGDRAVVELSARIAQGDAVIDCREIPDLVPVLSVQAAVTPGTTRFINAGRLRLKESDRLASTAAMLRNLGGQAEELPDGLEVAGTAQLAGGQVDSRNDHRIAMSAAVAALACTGPVTVMQAQAVRKSYPGFWEDYNRLGGKAALEEEQ